MLALRLSSLGARGGIEGRCAGEGHHPLPAGRGGAEGNQEGAAARVPQRGGELGAPEGLATFPTQRPLCTCSHTNTDSPGLQGVWKGRSQIPGGACAVPLSPAVGNFVSWSQVDRAGCGGVPGFKDQGPPSTHTSCLALGWGLPMIVQGPQAGGGRRCFSFARSERGAFSTVPHSSCSALPVSPTPTHPQLCASLCLLTCKVWAHCSLQLQL